MVQTQPRATAGGTSSDDSVADLVQRASRQTADLVRKELQLAQLELKQKGRTAGVGLGMFGAAGLIAFYGVAVLVAAAVLGLSTAVEPWLAALIVGAVLLAVAGVVAMVGKARTEEAMPAKPERAMASVHEDVEHIKEQAAR